MQTKQLRFQHFLSTIQLWNFFVWTYAILQLLLPIVTNPLAKAETLQSPSYAVLEVAEKDPDRFCILYYQDFKKFNERSQGQTMSLVNSTAYDGCSPLQRNYRGNVALVRGSYRCSLSDRLDNYKKSQASGVIITMRPSFTRENINTNRYASMLVAFTSPTTATSLIEHMPPKQPITVKFYTGQEMPFDLSLTIIWLIAVSTVGVGAYWSGQTRKTIFHQEQQPANIDHRRLSYVEESSLDISPILVVLFVLGMSCMLIGLYFFFSYLIYIIIGVFALTSVMAVIGALEPIVYSIPMGTNKIPKSLCPCFHSSLEIRQIILITFAISCSVVWVLTRHQSSSWFLQDMLGVAFSLNILKTLRMPSLKICTLLLVMLFFYDIFFVFITPFFAAKKESIMVEVARGENSQEMIPMVLRVPHLNAAALSACFSQYAMLGFGDILVPGLLASYCYGFDLIYGSHQTLYFKLCLVTYGLGLLLTFLGLYLMMQPQPALFYIVPSTLIPIIATAWYRNELETMWAGFKNAPVQANETQASTNQEPISSLSSLYKSKGSIERFKQHGHDRSPRKHINSFVNVKENKKGMSPTKKYTK